jgi:ATP-dependent helicase HrpA
VAESGGLAVYAYPGFRLTKTGVDLRLFKTPEEAITDLAGALMRFFEYELRYELSWLDRDLKEANKLGPVAITLLPLATLKEHIRENLRRFLCVRPVDPLTRVAFTKAAETSKNDSKGLLWKLLDQLEVILSLRQELLLLQESNPGVKSDLARLLPEDFLLRTPWPRIPNLSRYLQAIQARVRKARENPKRDVERAEAVARHQRRLSGLRKNPRIAVSDLADLFWMLEEYRVSLFAQELGTAISVSEKRIEQRFADLGG